MPRTTSLTLAAPFPSTLSSASLSGSSRKKKPPRINPIHEGDPVRNENFRVTQIGRRHKKCHAGGYCDQRDTYYAFSRHQYLVYLFFCTSVIDVESVNHFNYEPTVKLFGDSGTTYTDIQMVLDWTEILTSMHVDGIVPPPKRAEGRTPGTPMVLPTNHPIMIASSPNCSYFREDTPAPVDTWVLLCPQQLSEVPPLGMRWQHTDLPKSEFPSSELCYATT
ncbi:hypothetical protein EDD22DRAFT_1053458 [Suillus occidentalis]|nr:hypothetical protein EDD22DRAFT_1053458 [Suillus occidentalis]